LAAILEIPKTMTKQSLTDKLNKLFGLKSDYLGHEELIVTFSRNTGATKEEISFLDLEPDIKIPKDYLDFLTKYNGCTLFQFEDLGGFKFLGTADLKNEIAFQKEIYEEEWDERITVFCNLICDGDFISFKNFEDGTYEIIDCYHDDLPKNWTFISNSFDDFLEKLIDAKGYRYWL
jgi:hypothetical protein